MSGDDIEKLLEILGRGDLAPEDKLIRLCELFPNKRLPGKKLKNRLLRKKFYQDYHGTGLKKYAEKYGVTAQTLYNWLKM